MSLFDFGVTRTSRKRRASGDEVPSGSGEVPSSSTQDIPAPVPAKKPRAFQDAWLKRYPWLRYDGTLMYCRFCRAASAEDRDGPFVKGSANFRVDPLKSHEKSRGHVRAVAGHAARSNPDRTPLALAVNRMEKDAFDKMCILFNTAYHVAKEEMPFTAYVGLCDLQKKNGLSSVGDTYMNDKAARLFIHYISSIMLHDVQEALSHSPFLSVLSDGSTDRSTDEKEIVYVRYMDSGLPVVRYLGLAKLQAGDASGILEAIWSSFDSVGVSKEELSHRLVGFGADGASVMMGCHGGVAALIKQVAPQVVELHCVAHRLELAILDAAKKVPFINNFEATLKSVYTFYSRSPKRLRDLEAVAEVLQEHSRRPGGIIAVRWVASKQRAVLAMEKNWLSVVVHLKQAGTGTDDEAAKARGLLKGITTFSFLASLYFMLDFLEIATKLSKSFQADSATIISVSSAIERADLALAALAQRPGPHQQSLENGLSMSHTFKGEQVTDVHKKGEILGQHKKLVECTRKYMSDRFSTLKTSPVISASQELLDIRKWPTSVEELAVFGEGSMEKLLDHFGDILLKANCDLALARQELADLKVVAPRLLNSLPQSQRSSLAVLQLWQRIMLEATEQLPNVLQVISICLLLPLSTAVCERGFSTMNRIKTDWRCSLSADTTSELMQITINGIPLSKFDPTRAIEEWWKDGVRSRRPNASCHEHHARHSKDPATPSSDA